MEGGDDPQDKPPKRDVLFVHSPTPKGDGFHVIRAREDRVEVGEMSGLKEGEPVKGEIVKLKPRSESPRLFDVDVLAPAEERATPHAGPPQVATEAYRKNWEAVFASAPKPELLN